MTGETLLHAHDCVLPAAYALLPGRMSSPAATATVLAIGLQESGFAARRQKGRGPARGFWQFEEGGGVKGVLAHALTAEFARHACAVLVVAPTPAAVWTALEFNDTLAAAFARLLLWTVPAALGGPHEAGKAWGQYLEAWQPGRPREASWAGCYAEAWRIVTGA